MHSLRKGRYGAVAAGSLVLGALGAAGAVAAEPTATSTVKDASAWVAQAYENTDTGADLTPQQADVKGPKRTPFGTHSHRIAIGESTVQTELYRTAAYDGVALVDLSRLEYSTYARRTAGTGDLRQPTYLRLNVDNNADGVRDDSLYFIPANNAGQQPVANDVWQDWDVVNGKISAGGDAGPDATTTLAAYASAHPGSTLVNNDAGKPTGGAIALIAGGNGGGATDPQTNGEYFVDRVVVGKAGTDTLYDFGGTHEVAGTVSHVGVTAANLQGWVQQAFDYMTDEDLTTDQEFVHGPATAPAGAGSLRFTVSKDSNPNRVEQLRTPAYDGTLLRDLRTIGFSTFQRATGSNTTAQQPVYLRLNLDNDGDGTRDNSLFYFPGNNGAVQQGAWQTWDADAGKWSVDGDAGPAATVTLENYVVAHPDATIVNNASGAPAGGGVTFQVGAGGANQLDGEYFLDDVTLTKVDAATGATVSGAELDLEPATPAVSVGNVKVLEGNDGATLAFPVTLSAAAGHDVTVQFATADGTATAGKDYRARSGSKTIPAGATSATIKVAVLSDMVREGNETLTLTLTSPTGATLGDGTATGTIVNDDTRVGLGLSQATKHRVRVHVDTLPAAPGAVVKVYRVTKDGQVRVLKDDLNGLGRISRVLDTQYAPGTQVTLVATVKTEYGVYASRKATITIRK